MTEATRAFHFVGVGTPSAKEAPLRSTGLDHLIKYITSQDTAVPRQAEKLIENIAHGTEHGLLLVFSANRERVAAVRLPDKINEKYILNHFDVPADLPNIRKAIAMTVHMRSVVQYPGVAVIERYDEPDHAFKIEVASININELMARHDPLLHVIQKTQADLNGAPSS